MTAMVALTLEQAFDLALQRQQSGLLREAEQLYRQILAQQPGHVDALHNLGVLAHQVGRDDSAIDLFRQAIALRANLPQAYTNLGNVLRGRGQFEGAIAAYRQAIALSPDSEDAHNNLGHALQGKGQIDEAIAAYGQAIALRPNDAAAYSNLANSLRSKGRLDEAIAAAQQALALDPVLAGAHNNLGNALHCQGRLREAIAAYRQAIALKSDLPEAHSSLGAALLDDRQFDQAIVAFRQSIALRPSAFAYSNLGNALQSTGKLDDAIAAHRQAVVLDPTIPQAQSNLANALKESGQLDLAITVYRQTIALSPHVAQYHSKLIFSLHYHPAYSAHAIAAELERWNLVHAEPLRQFIQPHANDLSSDRRLRIGYLSPDFRQHAVGQNLLPLFLHHDRNLLDITCYAHVQRPDAMTRKFEQHADRWRNIVGLADEQVDRQIREDQIDILVDLSLHSPNNRLLIFARRPAPVQVTFVGYPGSTGMRAIDYRLSDPYLDPAGTDESCYSERTIRLPDSFWCYDPLEGRAVPVNRLPALESGVVTFGCLNSFCKIHEGVLSLWAQVLGKIPHSRLLMLAHPGSYRQWAVDRFAQAGVDPKRIEFAPPRPRRTYLELYHRIDIGLDSFPYNGHTTSLDSFWMGVPVVTLVGQKPVSRAGWCQLSNLGVPELAARTPEQFVEIAVALALDLSRLGALRSTLRRRMEQSPLMDAPRFARNIEAAYRQMWARMTAAHADSESARPGTESADP